MGAIRAGDSEEGADLTGQGGGPIGWFVARWPIRPLLRWSLEEEIAGGASYFYTLGATALFVFAVQAVTGVLMLMYYTPSVDHAYDASMYIRRQVPLGWFVYNLHYWGNNAFMVVVSLHVIRVFVWAAYKKPRELTWVLGVGLLLMALAMSFTGALLVWDQLGYWAAEVGTSIAGTVPVIGEWVKRALRDGPTMGPLTLTRFFALHVAILSGLLAGLIAVHVIAFRQFRSVGPWNPERRARIGWFWPDQVVKDLVVVSGVMVILIVLSAFWSAPITGMADPLDTSYEPKPEWNFLFLYQALKLFRGPWEPVGTVGLPVVLVLILLLLPFYDRNPSSDPKKRPYAMVGGTLLVAFVVVFTILGHLSRPGDGWVSPGAAADPNGGSSAEVQAGGKLFEGQGCIACHTVDGRGGKVGPDLSYEGSSGRTAAWLKEQIRDPRSHDRNAEMPAFSSLSDTQVDELVAYLLSLKAKDPPGDQAEAGRQLFESKGCISCHTVEGHGGKIGPDLSDEGNSGRSVAWLTEQIQSARSHNPDTEMPAFSSLSDKQIGGLVTYLLSLKKSAGASSSPTATAETGTPRPRAQAASTKGGEEGTAGQAAYVVGSASLGRLLFSDYCQTCHGVMGTGHVPNPGSEDGTVPPLNPIDQELYNADPETFARNIDPFLQHGSRPTGPNPALSMPDYGDSRSLTQAQISNVQAYVLLLNGVDRAKVMSPGIPPALFAVIFAGAIVVFWLTVGAVRLLQGRRSRGG